VECHECSGEAVGKCKSCGLAFCSGHGADLCRTCAVGFMELEPGRARPGVRVFLQCENRPRMPTVYLDDDGPPACHVCDGLARHVCENCHQLYCPEHAGRRGWCEECTRSSRAGLLLSLGVFGFIGVVLFLMYALEKFQK
jgi:hypothetical protein